MKSVLVYGYEITKDERAYGALEEFQNGLSRLRELGFDVVKDHDNQLTYVGCVVAEAEEDETCYFDMDDVMCCVERTSEMTAAVNEYLGHWVWLRIEAQFQMFSIRE